MIDFNYLLVYVVYPKPKTTNEEPLRKIYEIIELHLHSKIIDRVHFADDWINHL